MKKIEEGYDVSSVNYLKSPDHFSGNNWWFNRKYINRLPKISAMNHAYRWGAEQWICKTKSEVNYFVRECTNFGETPILINYKNENNDMPYNGNG